VKEKFGVQAECHYAISIHMTRIFLAPGRKEASKNLSLVMAVLWCGYLKSKSLDDAQVSTTSG
jgi:hypothetical protein